jgi:hypothetical protein
MIKRALVATPPRRARITSGLFMAAMAGCAAATTPPLNQLTPGGGQAVQNPQVVRERFWRHRRSARSRPTARSPTCRAWAISDRMRTPSPHHWSRQVSCEARPRR